MNKTKKKILGMPVMMFIIGLVVLGGASAMLVDYLSNDVTAEVAVDSPIALRLAEVDHGMTVISAIDAVDSTGDWFEDLPLIETTGLSTTELGLKVVNNADVDITNEEILMTLSNENNDVSCDDLSSLIFIDVGCSEGTSCYQVEQEVKGLCTELAGDDAGSVEYAIPITLWEEGNVYKYPVTLTFANVKPTSYDIEATVMIAE